MKCALESISRNMDAMHSQIIWAGMATMRNDRGFTCRMGVAICRTQTGQGGPRPAENRP